MSQSYGEFTVRGWYIWEQDDLSYPALTIEFTATIEEEEATREMEWEIVAGPFPSRTAAQVALECQFRQWEDAENGWQWEWIVVK